MRATAILDLVRRLLTHEAAESQDQASPILAAERVSDKMCTHLSKRIGQEGFRTLLARALALTKPNFPYLSAVRVGAEGSLVGLRGAIGRGSQKTQDNVTQNSEDRDNVVEGAVALLAQFLGLLVVFIGEDLMLRLISAVWPDFALPELVLDEAASGENETP